MKSAPFLIAFALAAICTAPLAQAAAPDNGGFFVTAKIGKTAWSLNDQYSDNQKATTYGAQAGYRWSINDANAIGFDVGYIDFGDIDDADGGLFATFSGSAMTAGANYQFTFAESWYLQARAGYMKLTLDSNVTLPGINLQIGPFSSNLGLSVSYESDEFDGIYLGVGIGHYFTPGFGLSLNYDYHQADDVYNETLNLATFTVAAEFRF
ncbi:MAG TPA: outer membrane beta-barrel protein [Gammaproteobacteria bacterium]|nr:outer membrane beta-barrel protein [Gammaproteobacteria bacterium]